VHGAANVLTYPRIVGRLDAFLRHRKTLLQSKALIRHRLETREERFLRSAARNIYGYTRSPYLPLLRQAGCELGDLQQAVRQRGLEGALRSLRDAGVYLTFEEFKGWVDVTRGTLSFRVRDQDFDNPSVRPEVDIRTGGTRSTGSRVLLNLSFIAEQRAPSYDVMLAAIGAQDVPTVIWFSGFPAGPGIVAWLALAHLGRPATRWFSKNDPFGPTVAPRHRFLVSAARTLGRLRGLDLPAPEFAPVTASATVLDTLLILRRRRGRAALITSPSAAVRLAGLAHRWGESLENVHLLLGSEPLTAGKAEEIRGTGATTGTMYVFTEGGAVGGACGDPGWADDMHFLEDCFALILNRRTMDAGEYDAFMFTSLLDSAPKIMLNVESDDFGRFESRRCTCPWGELGLHQHVGAVRSFTKLKGEGSTVLGTNCIQILEEVLPREFGGRSIDYQLLEAEDEQHLTRLFLLVSPHLGPIDEQALLARFVSALKVTDAPRGMPTLWSQAQTIRVVRQDPVPTRTGKLLPFHTLAFSPDRVLHLTEQR
jgi:hypothetical protein